MPKHRVIISELIENGVSTSSAENKVFEQCFDNLNLTQLVLAVNKQPRTRKVREAKPKV